MHSSLVVAASALFLSLATSVVAPLPPAGSPEARLATLDARQKEMVANGDVNGLADISASDLTINAPTNRILSRDQFFSMMRSGQIGAERFERMVESVTIWGNVGVVMGSELFTPTAKSELGRIYGARPLSRRYTNIYVFEHGKWKWLARHANVVLEPTAVAR